MQTLAGGGMAVVVDAPERENEGDLMLAAEHASAEAIAFMARYGRGLICAALPVPRLDALQVPAMSRRGRDPHGTAFHVSVDLRGRRAHSVAAVERAATIRGLADPARGAADFDQPGHVFPLGARPGGVFERPGHTEAAVELARLGGCRPAGAICEVMAEDGTMLRLPGLLAFAARHGLPVLAISDLVASLRPRTRSRSREAMLALPTDMPCVYDRVAHGPCG